MNQKPNCIGLCVALALLVFGSPLASAADADSATPQIASLRIESGRGTDGAFELRGQDARQQLLVTGVMADGRLLDLIAGMRDRGRTGGCRRGRSDGAGFATGRRAGDHHRHGRHGTASIRHSQSARPGPRGGGQFSQPNCPDLYQARLQQRRMPRQGQRPERVHGCRCWASSRTRTTNTWSKKAAADGFPRRRPRAACCC